MSDFTSNSQTLHNPRHSRQRYGLAIQVYPYYIASDQVLLDQEINPPSSPEHIVDLYNCAARSMSIYESNISLIQLDKETSASKNHTYHLFGFGSYALPLATLDNV